jgi:hypothetical protein
VVDRIDESPAGRLRPNRRGITSGLVCHRIGGTYGKTADSIIRFFTTDPEGVATVTLGGSYASKLPTIDDWRSRGVPADVLARAYVAYHFLVDTDGTVYQTLPLEVRGGHAEGWNNKSVGIGVVGDFRSPQQVEDWERRIGYRAGDRVTDEQKKALRELLRDLLYYKYKKAIPMTHDATLLMRGHPRKPCPGDYGEDAFKAVFDWALGAASQMGLPRRW